MLPEATQQDFPQWRKAVQVHPVWQKVPGGGAISGRRVFLSLSTVIIITLLSFCHYHAPPINHLPARLLGPSGPTLATTVLPSLACSQPKLKSYQNEH